MRVRHRGGIVGSAGRGGTKCLQNKMFTYVYNTAEVAMRASNSYRFELFSRTASVAPPLQ